MKKHIVFTVATLTLLSLMVSLPAFAELNQPGASYVDFGQGNAEWMSSYGVICLLGLSPAPVSAVPTQIIPTGSCPAIACQTDQQCCTACEGAHYALFRNGYCAYGW